MTRPNISRFICKVCSCTYEEGRDCLKCEQSKEYEESLRADAALSNLPDVISDPMLGPGPSHAKQATSSIQAQKSSDNKEQPFDLNEVRARRIAHFRRGDSKVTYSDDNPISDVDDLLPSGPSDSDTGIASGSQEDLHLHNLLDDIVSNKDILSTHRLLVKTDVIDHFKDPSVMKSS